jgi:hypothetical protein
MCSLKSFVIWEISSVNAFWILVGRGSVFGGVVGSGEVVGVKLGGVIIGGGGVSGEVGGVVVRGGVFSCVVGVVVIGGGVVGGEVVGKALITCRLVKGDEAVGGEGGMVFV